MFRRHRRTPADAWLSHLTGDVRGHRVHRLGERREAGEEGKLGGQAIRRLHLLDALKERATVIRGDFVLAEPKGRPFTKMAGVTRGKLSIHYEF